MPPHCPEIATALLLAFAAGTAAAEDDRDAQRGRALLAQYQCGACHAIPGVPASRGAFAQPLDHWRHRSYIAGRLPNRQDLLARWIVDPGALVEIPEAEHEILMERSAIRAKFWSAFDSFMAKENRARDSGAHSARTDSVDLLEKRSGETK